MQKWKEKKRNLRHYNEQAIIYDSQYIDEQNKKFKEILKEMNFRSNELILDLGCGTGFLFKHIEKKVELYIGLDISQKVLFQAKKRIKEKAKKILIRADADNTPFPDQSFDKIFAITIIQNMPEAKKTINEIKRISKPQAVIAVSGLKKSFTKKSFVELLQSSGLKLRVLKNHEEIKDHLALCTH
jgi:ubiquinone/menaquinone biosynthesis C-methylase UbiE